MEDRGMQCAIGKVAGGQAQVQTKRIPGQTQVLDSQLAGVGHQDVKHGGMQMEVQMAIDVVEGQAGGAELLKLRVNLLPQLVTQAALEKIAEPSVWRVIAELPFRVHQSGDLRRRQRGMTA